MPAQLPQELVDEVIKYLFNLCDKDTRQYKKLLGRASLVSRYWDRRCRRAIFSVTALANREEVYTLLDFIRERQDPASRLISINVSVLVLYTDFAPGAVEWIHLVEFLILPRLRLSAPAVHIVAVQESPLYAWSPSIHTRSSIVDPSIPRKPYSLLRRVVDLTLHMCSFACFSDLLRLCGEMSELKHLHLHTISWLDPRVTLPSSKILFQRMETVSAINCSQGVVGLLGWLLLGMRGNSVIVRLPAHERDALLGLLSAVRTPESIRSGLREHRFSLISQDSTTSNSKPRPKDAIKSTFTLSVDIFSEFMIEYGIVSRKRQSLAANHTSNIVVVTITVPDLPSLQNFISFGELDPTVIRFPHLQRLVLRISSIEQDDAKALLLDPEFLRPILGTAMLEVQYCSDNGDWKDVEIAAPPDQI